MKLDHVAWVAALVAVGAAACSPMGSVAEGGVGMTAQEGTTHATAVPVTIPKPTEVLDAIYAGDGNGISKGGQGIEFWYGHEFSLRGKDYFTGFADADTAKEGVDVAPDEQVIASQATYERIGDKWVLLDTQGALGKFGNRGQPLEPVKGLQPQTFVTPDGRYLIAVPVWYAEMGGELLHSVEVFAFSPEDGQWSYLGNVFTGSSNGSGCKSADAPWGVDCFANIGEVRFADGEDFPSIRVLRKGTDIDGNGLVRELGEDDSLTYGYDASTASYRNITN